MQSNERNEDDEEEYNEGNMVDLYDCNIIHLSQVKEILFRKNKDQNQLQKLIQNIRSLNLHGNKIGQIDVSLSEFINVQDLNLSSNNIERIEGLNALTHLRTLNLATNKITKIDGLGDLKNLKKLILSYNKIQSLEGLKWLHGPSFNLQYLDLRGNYVENPNELTYLFGLNKLKELYFQNGKDDGFANPVCKHERYRSILLSRLVINNTTQQNFCNLKILDGFKICIVKTKTDNDSNNVRNEIYLVRNNGEEGRNEFQEEDEISSTMTPYIGKYLQYIRKGSVVDSITVDATNNYSSNCFDLNQEVISSIDSNETQTQFVGLRKNKGVKSKANQKVIDSSFIATGILSSNNSLLEDLDKIPTLEDEKEEEEKIVEKKENIVVLPVVEPPQPSQVIRILVRDEITQTDISSTIVDQMLRFRSVNLYDMGIQTDTPPEISKEDDKSESYISNSQENQIILELRNKVEDLCRELGSCKVYIQQREQELAVETNKKISLEEELSKLKANCIMYKKQLLEIDESTKKIIEERDSLKEHDSHLQKEIERVKRDAYNLEETKNKAIKAQQKEYETLILALKKKLDQYSKANNEIFENLKQTKDELTSTKQSSKSTIEKLTTQQKQEIIELKQKYETIVSELKESHQKILEEQKRSFEERISQTNSEYNKKFNDIEEQFKNTSGRASEMKKLLAEFVKKEMHYTSTIEELKTLTQSQKQRLNEMVNSKQEIVKKLSQQIEEVNNIFSRKEQQYKSTIEKLSNEIESQKTQLDDLSNCKQTLSDQVKEISFQCSSLQNENDELKKKIENKDDVSKQDFERKLENLKESLTKEKEAALKIKNVIIMDKDDTIVKQKEELNKLKDKIATLERDLEREINEKEDFYRNDNNKDTYIEELEHKLKESQKAAQKEKGKRQKCRDELNARLEQIEDLESRLSKAQEQYQISLSNLDKEKQHNRELTLQLSKIENEMQIIQNGENSKQQKIKLLEQLVKELNFKISQQEEKKKKYAQILQSKEEDVQLLTRALKQQQELRKSAEEKLLKFTSALQDLPTKILNSR